MAREWIKKARHPNPNLPKKIIYYTRNSFKDGMITLANGHTKAMAICQELVIIRTTIRRQIERSRRSFG